MSEIKTIKDAEVALQLNDLILPGEKSHLEFMKSLKISEENEVFKTQQKIVDSLELQRKLLFQLLGKEEDNKDKCSKTNYFDHVNPKTDNFKSTN